MKTLKKVLIVVGIIIALPLLMALFIANEYTVERSVDINRPRNEVFDYVKHLKNQDKFSVWAQADPDMVKEYRGEDGTVGFVSSWDSKMEDVGKGEQEIINIDEGHSVDFELRFFRPWEGVAQSSMTTEEAGIEQTHVRWTFHGKMPYPMNFMLLFGGMDEGLGTPLQKGLDNLKSNLEMNEGVAGT